MWLTFRHVDPEAGHIELPAACLLFHLMRTWAYGPSETGVVQRLCTSSGTLPEL